MIFSFCIKCQIIEIYKKYVSEPNPVTGIIEVNATTESLDVQVVPPVDTVYQAFKVNLYVEENWIGNVTYSNTLPHFLLVNLTAGTGYKVSVSAATVWEDSDSFNKTLYTCEYL